MNRLVRTNLILLAGLSIAACGAPEQGIRVDVNHDCNETTCEVLVEIQNPSKYSYDVDYDFAAFDRDSGVLVELDESIEIEANQSWSYQYVFPVTSKPMMITSGSGTFRHPI